MKEYVLMFDVESISLHGEGFAVAAVVANKRNGIITSNFQLLSLEGEAKASDWVKENILPCLQQMPTCETSRELRDKFYEFYMQHKETCDVWSDCNFPVETNFLSAIVADDHESRQWEMPYPLLDLCTIVDANIDRINNCGEGGLIKHNPLHDSIASLRMLLLTIQKQSGQ